MLTLALSEQIISKALIIARQNNFNIAIAVTDSHGDLMGFARIDNASSQAGLLAQNKAYTRYHSKCMISVGVKNDLGKVLS
jgi:glc operon protein GlcG